MYVLRGFCMLWGCKGPLTCWTPLLHLPLYGGASHVLHPHSLLPSCASVCFGNICMLYGEYFPYVGDLGVFPHLLGVLETSAHGVSICLFFYILVVHYVSHFYYSYNYYSSSYGGVFWAAICFISDCGLLP